MRYLAILTLLLFTSCSDTTYKVDENPNRSTQKAEDSDSKTTLNKDSKLIYLEAINSARATDQMCGNKLYSATHKLNWNNALYKASLEHAKDMALNSMLEHYGSNTNSDITSKALKLNRGSDYDERDKHNGYTHFKRVTENIARGTSLKDAQSVVNAWLKSPSHCANLMDPNVKDVGMANYLSSDNYKNYWSQNFGAR